MERIISIEEFLNNQINTLVFKSRKSVWPGVLQLLVAVGLFIVSVVVEWPPKSIYPPLLMMAGTVFLVLGFWKTVVRKELFISTDSRQPLKPMELYYDLSESAKLVRIYQSGDFEKLPTLRTSERGALKIRLLVTADHGLCVSQVIGFEGLEHTALTLPRIHSKDESVFLLNR